eukprot:29330-Pelagococcus_subviridis.AAC.1
MSEGLDATLLPCDRKEKERKGPCTSSVVNTTAIGSRPRRRTPRPATPSVLQSTPRRRRARVASATVAARAPPWPRHLREVPRRLRLLGDDLIVRRGRGVVHDRSAASSATAIGGGGGRRRPPRAAVVARERGANFRRRRRLGAGAPPAPSSSRRPGRVRDLLRPPRRAQRVHPPRQRRRGAVQRALKPSQPRGELALALFIRRRRRRDARRGSAALTRVVPRLQRLELVHHAQHPVLLLRVRLDHLRHALRELRAAEPVHPPDVGLHGVDEIALVFQSFVLHPRALRERLEAVVRDRPEPVGVVFAADVVQEFAPVRLVHTGRTHAPVRVLEDVVEEGSEAVLGVLRVRRVGARDGGDLSVRDERRGHPREAWDGPAARRSAFAPGGVVVVVARAVGVVAAAAAVVPAAVVPAAVVPAAVVPAAVVPAAAAGVEGPPKRLVAGAVVAAAVPVVAGAGVAKENPAAVVAGAVVAGAAVVAVEAAAAFPNENPPPPAVASALAAADAAAAA